MGIERNNRKPKRRRTTAQRLKGRQAAVYQLPEGPPAPVEKKAAKPKAEAKPKAAAKPKAPAKKTAKPKAE